MKTSDKWWYMVMDFAVNMIERFEEKEAEGWYGHDNIKEEAYQERAIKNIREGNYTDAANLCLLAQYAHNRGWGKG